MSLLNENSTDLSEINNLSPTDEKTSNNLPEVRSLSRKSNIIPRLNHPVNILLY